MFPWSLSSASIEPVMPRKKKHPELAYRSNQVLKFECEGGDSSDSLETVVSTGSDLLRARVRSEERSNVRFLPGPRSRSADPSLGRSGKKKLMTQSFPPAINLYSNRIPDEVVNKSEYRSQYAWPVGGDPRKSVSMGTIAATQPKEEVPIVANSFPKLTSDYKEESIRRKVKKTEYKSKFRPFSSYLYVDGNWRKPSKNKEGNSKADPNSWYTEVVERIKKADEYRSRAHGRPLYGEMMTYSMPTRDAELWSQNRDRSSLLALSLASSPRPPGRDEKVPERAKTAVHKTSSKKEPSRPISAERKKSPSEKRKSTEKEGLRPKSAEPPLRQKKPSKPITSPLQHKTAVNGPSEEPHSKNPDKKSHHPAVHHRTKPTERISPQKEHQTNTPRAVTRPGSAAPAPMVNGGDGKIWLKPATTSETSKEPAEDNKTTNSSAINGPVSEEEASSAPPAEKDHHARPSSLPAMNGVDSIKENGQDYSSPSPLPEPHTGPVPLTTVRSPEEVTGVKSPDPECWTVPLETNKGLEWMDGHTPVEGGRVKSPPLSGSFQPVHSQTFKGENMMQAEPVSMAHVSPGIRSHQKQFFARP